MKKEFVRIGIDHGTANSSIAVMESDGPRVIKPNGVDVTMPSAVYIDRRGRMLIGGAARRAMLTNPLLEGIGHTCFKPRLGYDDSYPFPNDTFLTGPELGGHVMSTLLKSYGEEMQEHPVAAVITVPAKFENFACKATQEAAHLAGLAYAPTLMEPVAAGLAYGFDTADRKAQWATFDMGAGTTDLATIILRGDKMDVPREGNAGDNHLGGRKFDREIFDYIMGPRKQESDYEEKLALYRKLDPNYSSLRLQYDLDEFSKESHPAEWGRLMLAVEESKIELSSRSETVVEVVGVLCEDARGTAVKVELPLSRRTYEHLIEADVMRAVDLCQKLLHKNRLNPSDIQRLILIGGPTKTPLLQSVLVDRLGIPLESSIDPMTAVAQGAAIFAAKVEIPSEIVTHHRGLKNCGPEGGIQVTVEYEACSKLASHGIVGRVEGLDSGQNGYSVEIERKDGLYSTGRLPMEQDGVFSADLLLIHEEKPIQSRFRIRVFNSEGRVVAEADEPNIWHPYVDVPDQLPSDLMVGVDANDSDVLLAQGTRLPAKKTSEFKTSAVIRKGSQENILKIPVLESIEHYLGDVDLHQDCNISIGELIIKGSEIEQDLPGGAVVDVTLHRDRDRQIRVEAFIPYLDEDFEAVFESKAQEPAPEEVEERFKAQRQRLIKIQRLQDQHPMEDVAGALGVLEEQAVESQILTDIRRAREGDLEGLSRGYRALLRLTGGINALHEMQTLARIRRFMALLKTGIRGSERNGLKSIEKEINAAAAHSDHEELKNLERQADNLYWNTVLKPVIDLHWSIKAFPRRFKGYPDQLAAFNRAEKAYIGVLDTMHLEGAEAITGAQIKEAQRAHHELKELWRTELAEWQKALDKGDDEKPNVVFLAKERSAH